jgi:hypothetical protein
MSKAEILAELPKLKAEERTEVFELLCELRDQDLISSSGPSVEEMRLLDEALAEYQRDKNPGRPWREVLREIRSSGRS